MLPRVSCVMPTRERPQLALHALQCFHAQNYPSKELIILDDGDAPSFPLTTPFGPDVCYLRDTKRHSIGYKRNQLAALADGEWICHFDSDDYSHPDRIACQVELLKNSGKEVAGFHSILFASPVAQRAWKYTAGRPDYALGTSLFYTRRWWAEHPFPDIDGGEDDAFMRAGREAGQLVSADGQDMIIARIHSGNISQKHPDRCELYTPVVWMDLPQEFRSIQ